jgi:hypothetical protein
VLSLGALSASAEDRATAGSHAVMHEMMNDVHSPGTSRRMHRVEAAEEMMTRRSDIMTAMKRRMDQGPLDEMTSGDRMDGGMMMEMMSR